MGAFSQRVQVASDPGRTTFVAAVALILDRADIEAIELEDGKLTNTLVVVFRDGTGKLFESPKIDTSQREFIEALG